MTEIENKPVVPFNETMYPWDTIDEAIHALRDSLASGWVVTGPRTLDAERVAKTACKKEHAVGYGIAPFFPMAAALAEWCARHDRELKVMVQATAWPEHVACFAAFGFEVRVFDIAKPIRSFPSLALDELYQEIYEYQPTAVFTNDVHGVAPEGLNSLFKVCEENDCLLIHDISYGYGARSASPEQPRTIGHIITMSLNPGKLVTGLNGGIALTNDHEMNELLRVARLDGLDNKKNCFMLVGDWRMLEVQAEVVVQSMANVRELIKERIEIAKRYDEAVSQNPELTDVAVFGQHEYSGMDRYTLRIPVGTRDKYTASMHAAGIQLPRLTYDIPVFRHYAVANYPGLRMPRWPSNADDWCRSHVLIPLHNKLSEEQIERVCEWLRTVKV